MSKSWWPTLLLFAGGSTATFPAVAGQTQADQQQALAMIRETARDMCNTVQDHGESSSSEVQGEIKAKLNGLVSRLAEAGVSGTGSIRSEQFNNVLHADLAKALDNAQACRMDVFHSLADKLLK